MTAEQDPWHINIYDGPTWRLRTTIEVRESSRIVWSPDGRILATACTNGGGAIRLWDTASGHQRAMLRRQQDQMPLRIIAFRPHGATLASGDNAGMLTLLDLDALRVRSAVQAHTSTVFGLAFAPDGRMLATGAGDGMIKIWDADTLQGRATLQGHRGIVRCVAFSPDGETLASGSDDGTIRLWDTYTLQELIVLEAHEQGVGTLTFTADGRTLVSGGTSANGTGEVAFWSGSLRRAELGTR